VKYRNNFGSSPSNFIHKLWFFTSPNYISLLAAKDIHPSPNCHFFAAKDIHPSPNHHLGGKYRQPKSRALLVEALETTKA
jgi:hypothetical protein